MSLYPVKASANQKIQGEQGTTPELLSWIAHYHQHPVLGSSKTIHATLTCGEAAVDVITAITQPDVARNLIVTGNAGATEKITITGTDAAGAVISEEFTMDATTPKVGAKAFKTVTKIHTPIGTHTAAIICGDVLGLIHLLKYGVPLSKFSFNSTVDAGTMVASATVLANNTYAPAGTLDGTKPVDLWYAVDA